MQVESGLYNVVIGWNMSQGEEDNANLKRQFVKTLTAVNDKGFKTDAEHITFTEDKEEIDRLVENGECDVLIVSESLSGVAIGTGAIKVWKKDGRKIKIILVMSSKKRGSGKVQGLYKMAYYRGLFISDLAAENITELVCRNREPSDAFEYYGVGYCRDVDEKVKETGAKDTSKEAQDKKESEKKLSRKEKKKASKKKEKLKKAGEQEKTSVTEKVMEDVVSSEDEYDGLLGGEYVDDKDFLDLMDSDGLSDDDFDQYADIPESGDGSYETDDSYALDLLIPADANEKEIDIKSVLEGGEDACLSYIREREDEAFSPFAVSYEPNIVDEVCEAVLTHYTQEDPQVYANLEKGIMNEAEFNQDLELYLSDFNISDDVREAVKDSFYEFMWGYDIITPFINDPTISDIKLEAPDRIRIKRYGKRYFSKVVFRSENHYRAFVSHVARKNYVDIKEGDPDATFMDNKTSKVCSLRFVLSTEYINSNGFPSLVIRKVPNEKYTIEQLVNQGMMDIKTAAFLLEEVRAGKSFLVTGSMASGKTTWMNTYLDFISRGKSILAMQENRELFSNVHPDTLFQEIKSSQKAKAGEKIKMKYDLRYLSTYGLLMDVDYFMIGEIKGAEARQFIEAVYTNTVCWASLHCPSSRDALPRVADLAKQDADDYSVDSLLERLAAGIDYVIFLEHFKLKEVVKVKGYDRDNKEVIYEDVSVS